MISSFGNPQTVGHFGDDGTEGADLDEYTDDLEAAYEPAESDVVEDGGMHDPFAPALIVGGEDDFGCGRGIRG